MKGVIVMYDYEENALLQRIDALTAENERLRKEMGEFGFFGSQYSAPWVMGVKDNLKNQLTVADYDLLSKINIGYEPAKMHRCIKLLNWMLVTGVFNRAQGPYIPAGGYKGVSPMAPEIPPVPGPDEYTYDVTGFRPVTGPIKAANTETMPKWFDIPGSGPITNGMFNDDFKKLLSKKCQYNGEVLSIDFPIKMADKLHEEFKGMEEYRNNSIIITKSLHGYNSVTVTLCLNELKDREKINQIIDQNVDLLIRFITDETVGSEEKPADTETGAKFSEKAFDIYESDTTPLGDPFRGPFTTDGTGFFGPAAKYNDPPKNEEIPVETTEETKADDETDCGD
jgi:hypothetical protein